MDEEVDESRRTILKLIGAFGVVTCGTAGLGAIILDSEVKYRSYGNTGLKHDDDVVGVMTYNIKNAKGDKRGLWDRISDEEHNANLRKIISTCRNSNATIIGLNEIGFGSLKSGYVNQASAIAQCMCQEWGVAYVAEGINVNTRVFRFGNAIVSKYPIVRQENTVFGWSLERIHHELKGFLDTTVRIGDREIDVLITHIYNGDIEYKRISEIKEIMASIKGKKNSTILMACPIKHLNKK